MLCVSVVAAYYVCVVAHDSKFGVHSMDGLLFNHHLESIAHDSNEHIEHCNLREECSCDKEHPAQIILRMVVKTIMRKLSKTK